MRTSIILLTALLLAWAAPLSALEMKDSNINLENLEVLKMLEGIDIEGKFYITYRTGHTNAGNFNLFSVDRSYFTLKKKLPGNLSSRITMDSKQSASGDMYMRLKYLYAQWKFDDMGFIAKPNVEFGMAHNPWFDFEESVAGYRVLGKQYAEKVGLLSSADVGIMVAGLFGGTMDKDYQKKVSRKYPGRYGSFAVGVYNGGGYSSAEKNQAKALEYRITLRPIPDAVPGLQASYFGVTGNGNTAGGIDDLPDWNNSLIMLSYQAERFVVTGQTIMGKGNQSGSFAPTDFSGYSVFGRANIVGNYLAMLQLDQFDPDVDTNDDASTGMTIAAGYDFGKKNMLILDYSTRTFENSAKDDENTIKLTMQISY